MPPKKSASAASAEEDKSSSVLSASSRPRRSVATKTAKAGPDSDDDDDGPKASKTHTKTSKSKGSPIGASPPASARGGVVAEGWQQDKDWERTYLDDVPSPTSPSMDPRAQIGEGVKRWFSEEYLDTFISHFRRNTVAAVEKRPMWIDLIRKGNTPFAGHPINLDPADGHPHMKYLGYFNYMEHPRLGVSDSEMAKLNKERGRRPGKLVILIGGASVGKTSIKNYFVQNATDLDVDEPVMYANAMVEMMPEKERMWGKGQGINQRYIIYAVVDRLIRNGDDIIIDSTGGSKMAIHYSMNKAKEAGYQIVCVAVWAPLHIASTRCDSRTATTMRKMSGHGVKFTFEGAEEGKFMEHYALKPRFRNKIDLFFLIDNTRVPTPELVSAAQAATETRRDVLDDITIPPTTVLIFKNRHNPHGSLQTDLVYRTPRSNIGDTNFYGYKVHLPESESLDINPSEIIRHSPYHPSSSKKGGRRTRKLVKIQKTQRHHKSSNTHSRRHHRRHVQSNYTRRW